MKYPDAKILCLEDKLADRSVLEREAKEAPFPFTLVTAVSVKEALPLLGKHTFQAIVADLQLADGLATDLIPMIGNSPLIILTDEGSENRAAEALKSGAYDYLIKDIHRNYLKILPIIITKSIEQKKQRDELASYRSRLEDLVQERTVELTEMYVQLKESEANFKNIFNNTSDSIIITDFDFNFLEANDTLLKRFGVTKEYLSTLKMIDFLVPSYHKLIYEKLELTKRGFLTGDLEIEVISPITHQVIPYEVNNVPIMFDQKNAILTVMRDITERKSIARKLFETIIHTEEEERSRIARDLHDDIGPLLSSLKMYTTSFVESIDTDKKNSIAAQIGQIIRNVIDSIKEISNDMSPHVLVSFGLQAAIQNTGSLFPENLSVHHESNLGGTRFPGTVELVVYRIIKELINNTVKHARASNIFIRMEYNSPSLICQYRDDGIGFDMQLSDPRQTRGMGITNIASRIKSLGGDYQIMTKPGEGFRIELEIRTESMNHHDR